MIEYEQLLCAIFCTKASNRNNTYLELDKQSLVQILKDAQIIKTPVVKKAEAKVETKKGAKPTPADKGKDGEEKKEVAQPEEALFTEADCL